MNDTSPTPAAATTARAVPDVPTPDRPTPDALLALFAEPLLAAARGRARRDALFGRRVRIQHRARLDAPEGAAIVRGDETLMLGGWPSAAQLRDGDHVVVQIDADADGRARWLRWLTELATVDLPQVALAPCSRTAAGLHPLWCIAVARLVLGPVVSIVARHDLLGVRLAQVALGFGADVLAGPIDRDRSLPLCGVTRPDETTLAGLGTLIRHAGLTAIADATGDMEDAR